MNNLSRGFYFVLLFNLLIAIGFFLSNKDAGYTSLSSDIQNIIPIAQKFDDPTLFKKDLYVNSLDNVRYYTPFYVQPLRFFSKFTKGDYVQAINIKGFICHLLFGVLWFYLFFLISGNFWASFLVSILVRGVVWLPGFEIIGISDIWTIMPRTVYFTIMPIPFIFLFREKLLLAFFTIGLLFNFHPITGLGGIILFVLFCLFYSIFFNSKKIKLRTIFLSLALLFIGMLPFLITYLSKTSVKLTYDPDTFTKAFNTRIPLFFSEGITYLKQWLRFKTLFFLFPMCVLLYLNRNTKNDFKYSVLVLVLSFMMIIIPLFSLYIEQLVNSLFNLNIRMSFQLIRMQKLAVLPGYVALLFLVLKIPCKWRNIQVLPVITALYLFVLIVCKLSVFNNIPFIGDDLSRHILPDNLSFGSVRPKENISHELVAKYVSENTNKDAVIYGSHVYRGASKRSVVLDTKGAGMIIEGNPVRFIEWYKNNEELKSKQSSEEKVNFLKSLGVTHMVTKEEIVFLSTIYQSGNLNLYKL